jgi:hypothetical protein
MLQLCPGGSSTFPSEHVHLWLFQTYQQRPGLPTSCAKNLLAVSQRSEKSDAKYLCQSFNSVLKAIT